MKMERSPSFLVLLVLIFIAGTALSNPSTARRSRVRRQNMKVQINATGDTIVMKFVRPNADIKLEGYILGYGSSLFSKQFIQLPENGQPYETEIDAEPKYLIAVQPIPANDVKKQCTGKVNLEKPLHLVIGSVTPSSVLLSWGTHLKMTYEGNIMNDCLEDGHYTVRYRERNRKWIYQTCPTSDTVVDNLKPNTAYEFGVRPNSDDRSGGWSKPVIHNPNMGEKAMQKPYKPRPVNPVKPIMAGPRAFFPPRQASTPTRQDFLPTLRPTMPLVTYQPIGRADHPRSASTPLVIDSPKAPPHIQPSKPLPTPITPISIPRPYGERLRGQAHARPRSQTPSKPQSSPQPHIHSRPQPVPARVTPRQQVPTVPSQPEDRMPLARPALATEMANKNDQGTGVLRPAVPHSPASSSDTTKARNTTLPRGKISSYSTPNGIRPLSLPRGANTSPSSSTPRGPPTILRPSIPVSKKPYVLAKQGHNDKPMDLKQGDKESILKPLPVVTAKPKVEHKQTTTITPSFNGSRYDVGDNSSVFSSLPASEVDAMGKKRFIAPHVVYKTDKKPDEPCSITRSLSYFPEEEAGEQNVTGPPRSPPSNVTVVTVEGCPSFVILDWEKTDNDTTEYEVISTTKGPNGEEVSILTTNQTHTAVENLKPESSYEFTVKPKNELGSGPSSESVSFSTESADPRVSENVAGKDAIWTQFPFKTDAYSECNGKQYVKRTWYRKFVGIQLCNSLRYKIYLSDSLNGKFFNIGDQTGHGEDHCQFVDSFLDGRTGSQLLADQLPGRTGFYRAMRQEPVNFGEIGGNSHVTYVGWYECGAPIPGKW
ncbi:target of Nesh-SH3-like isoform 2-T3 [Aplochiton taeniatus]